MRRFLKNWIGLAIIWLLGGGLFLANFFHVTSEGESFQTVLLGVLLPMLISIGILLSGIWLWQRDFTVAATHRIGGWCLVGVMVLGLSAVLAIRFQQTHGVHMADQEFVILNSATGGALIGFVIGLYDAQRHRRQREIQAREQALHDLHTTTRDLVQMTDQEEIATHAVQATRDILGLPICGCWIYDGSENVLEPVAVSSEGSRLISDVPTYTEGGSLSWEAFETGQMMAIDDVRTHPTRHREDSTIRSEIILPLGDYGVINIGSPETNAFDDVDVSLARILAANTQTALERADHEHQLEMAHEEATQLNRQLTVLNRVFRHDLRNAANVIQGHARLLVEDSRTDTTAKSATTIQEQASDLVALSEQVRDIEQILQDDTSEQQVVDLVEIISAQLDRIERNYAGVQTDGPNWESCRVSTHPLVESAIRNVTDNAVEHNDAQSPRIDVAISHVDDQVEVRIADNGPGIPADEVAVLERGYETPLEHTSGLGLWLVSWIVRESGGDVFFQERDPRGSVVCLRFEMAKAEAGTDPETIEH